MAARSALCSPALILVMPEAHVGARPAVSLGLKEWVLTEGTLPGKGHGSPEGQPACLPPPGGFAGSSPSAPQALPAFAVGQKKSQRKASAPPESLSPLAQPGREPFCSATPEKATSRLPANEGEAEERILTGCNGAHKESHSTLRRGTWALPSPAQPAATPVLPTHTHKVTGEPLPFPADTQASFSTCEHCNSRIGPCQAWLIRGHSLANFSLPALLIQPRSRLLHGERRLIQAR